MCIHEYNISEYIISSPDKYIVPCTISFLIHDITFIHHVNNIVSPVCQRCPVNFTPLLH